MDFPPGGAGARCSPHGSGSCFALARPNYGFKVLRFSPSWLGVCRAERVLSFLGCCEGEEPLPIWNRVGFFAFFFFFLFFHFERFNLTLI